MRTKGLPFSSIDNTIAKLILPYNTFIMSGDLRIITVFGSSHPREGETDYEEARVLGRALAERGFAVCTGGYAGVMEAVSRGAKEAGGRTIAITATFFRTEGERLGGRGARRGYLAGAAVRADPRWATAIVACKGGTGTLVELAVVWEMLNKGVMAGKPFVTLGDFWAPIIERVREVETEPRIALGRSARRGWCTARKLRAEAAEFLAEALRAKHDEDADGTSALKRFSNSTGCAICCAARTTSAPGRRAIEALAFRTERAPLEREFAAVARGDCLPARRRGAWFWRAGRSGAWLERLDMPGAVLAPAELLDAASLVDYAACAARNLSRDLLRNFRCSPSARVRWRIFALLAAAIRGPFCRTAKSATMRRRRCGAFAEEWRARARPSRKRSSAFCARGAANSRRRLRHAAQRPLRDSGASVGAAQPWTAWCTRPAPRARRSSSSRSKPSS